MTQFKIFYFFIVAFFSTQATFADPPRQTPSIQGSWSQSLNENFDGSQLNSNIWNKNVLWNGGLGGSIFKKDHVHVENGKLVITTSNEDGTDSDGKKFYYSSGLIQSFGKWTQTYGYFTARMKLPTLKGLWPAFWTMPDRLGTGGTNYWWESGRRNTEALVYRGVFGKGMEIDIMEHMTIHGPNKFHQALHWDGYGSNHKKLGLSQSVKSSSDGYREFSIYWEKNMLIWYIDGKEMLRWESTRVPDVGMYLLLNTATGGWDGNKITSPESLPQQTLVDYVKAWKGKRRESVEGTNRITLNTFNQNAQIGGSWNVAKSPGYKGGTFRYNNTTQNGTGFAKIKWPLNIPTAGKYRVYATFLSTNGRSSRAKYTIGNNLGTSIVKMNQRIAAVSGAQAVDLMYPLGVFEFKKGQHASQYVQIDNSDANGTTIADTVILERVAGSSISAGDSDSGDSGTTGPKIEKGKISIRQSSSTYWRRVNFKNSFNDPIVVMSPVSYNGSQPAVVRVKDVTKTGFSFQVDEWQYLDGGHTDETVGYLVLERGLHTIGGKTWEAGKINNVNHNWTRKSLQHKGFRGGQIILAQTVTYNGSAAVTVRMDRITDDTFDIYLQEEEGQDGRHADETVHYMAITNVSGSSGNMKWRTGKLTNLNDAWKTVAFDEAIDNPVVFGQICSHNGSDAIAPRYDNLSATKVQFLGEEEQSADDETGHTNEEFRWIVIGE